MSSKPISRRLLPARPPVPASRFQNWVGQTARPARAGAAAVLLLASCGGTEKTAPMVTSEPTADATRADGLWAEGRQLERRGDLDGALERWREAIRVGPYDEGRRYYFGARFIQRRPLDEVESYYRQQLDSDSDPKPQTSHYLWGAALMRHGRHDRAAEQFRRALEIDPAHEMTHELWGTMLEAGGDLEGAVEHYRRAVEIFPDLRSAHLRLAGVLDKLGRAEEASEHRGLAAASDPETPRRYLYLGRALLRAGRPAAAITELEKAIEATPDDAEARALLAEARRRLAG